MNTPANSSIFNETGCVRKELLLRYRDNQLGNDEKHEVEEHLIDCPLCSEALEGLALISGTGILDEIQRDVGKVTSVTPAHSIRPWLAAATLAGIAAISYYAFEQYSGFQDEQVAILQETSAPVQEEVQPTRDHTAAGSGVPVISDTHSLSPVEQPVLPNEQQMEPIVETGAVSKDEVAETLTGDDESAVRSMEIPSAASPGTIVFNAPVSSNISQNITYVDNVKVIDYTTYELGNVKEADVPRSVSSKYQNEKKKQEMAETEKATGDVVNRKADYIDLVSDPIILFNKGRYESANAGFDQLLKMNSNDQNAAFYKGMSLYNLKQYDPALKFLEPISNDTASPFMEEAKFYTAKSLISNGDTGNGKRVLKEIVSKNGFYSRQAADELNRIDNK